MEENSENNGTSNKEEEIAEQPSHFDLITGIFSEPRATFDSMVKYPLRTSDWLIPLCVILLLSIGSSFVLFSNPAIVMEVREKQMAKTEKALDEMVASGKMTTDQKNEQLDSAAERINDIGSTRGMIFQSVMILIFGSIIYFLICAVYFGIAKFFFAAEGEYRGVLVASSMSSYINVISIILIAIVSMLMDKTFADLSVATLAGVDRQSITGYLLSRLDVFSIASFFVFGVGLSRTMFQKAKEMTYLYMVFGLWIGFTALWFLLTKYVPFLGMFTQ